MDNRNEGLTKKNHPYIELLTACIAMLGFPYLIYIMFSAAMKHYTRYSPALIAAQAEGFAGLIGTAFALMLFLSGIYKRPWQVTVERWKEFFGYARYGLWASAFQSLWLSIKEEGMNFLFYIALTAIQLWLAVDGINRFFTIIGWK